MYLYCSCYIFCRILNVKPNLGFPPSIVGVSHLMVKLLSSSLSDVSEELMLSVLFMIRNCLEANWFIKAFSILFCFNFRKTQLFFLASRKDLNIYFFLVFQNSKFSKPWLNSGVCNIYKIGFLLWLKVIHMKSKLQLFYD